MKQRLTYSLMIFLLLMGMAKAQKTYEASGDKNVANEFFQFGDYVTSLKEYQFLYDQDSTNPDFLFRLGICYANTTIDKRKAIYFLEKVVAKKNFDAEAMYQLGKVYQITNRFDEAIDCYQKFITLSKGNDKNRIPAGRCIEMCNNAKELTEHAINVTFENAGAKINSPFPDYSPFINKNETVLYYTSKRTGNMGGMIGFDGYNTADIFQCESKYGTWGKAKRLASTINSPMIEELSGLSTDGSYLFVYLDNLTVKAQTQVSVKSGKSFQLLKPMGININPVGKGTKSITITPDKKIVFFSLNNEGEKNGSDIFMSKLLPSGQWGPAENIGKTINTPYDEDYPYLAPDGKTLYFASAGHNSMGGLDIFRTVWNREDNTFSEPENIGYPVNTPDDNTNICFSASGRYAYISALRYDDSYGNLDIYRVIFNDVKAVSTTLVGLLTNKDSANVFDVFYKETKKTIDSLTQVTDPVYASSNAISDSMLNVYKTRLALANKKLSSGPEVNIQVQNASDLTTLGTYKPNRTSGKFVIILPPGKYNITIKCEGFQEFKETLKIDDRETPIKEISRSFQLTPNL